MIALNRRHHTCSDDHRAFKVSRNKTRLIVSRRISWRGVTATFSLNLSELGTQLCREINFGTLEALLNFNSHQPDFLCKGIVHCDAYRLAEFGL